jgi:hypothetical protein
MNARNSTTNPYRPLNATERKYLCWFIRALVPIARDSHHPMRDLARREISMTMWRWTADAYHIPTGKVKQDAFKYNPLVHAITKSAKTEFLVGSPKLRHEHAVPRMALTKRIVEHDLDEDGIYGLLERLCVAVIVTVREDRKLKPKDKMPSNWDWNEGHPYQRYVDSGLNGELIFPSAERDANE